MLVLRVLDLSKLGLSVLGWNVLGRSVLGRIVLGLRQPVRTLFLFKSIWIHPQGSQGCQKMGQGPLNVPFKV